MNWTVATVLRKGGDFKVEHVQRLRDMVDHRFKNEHTFVCLTDAYVPGVDTILLTTDWSGWWAKLELFKLWPYYTDGPILYLDLDTALVGDFTLPPPAPSEMFMLEDFLAFGNLAFKSRWWASGVMMWNTDLHFIFERAVAEGYDHFSRYYQWDQIFIGKCLGEQDIISPRPVSSVVTVRSYKVHNLSHEMLGNDDQIVCFHGQPRPWDVETSWVKELWHGHPSN